MNPSDINRPKGMQSQSPVLPWLDDLNSTIVSRHHDYQEKLSSMNAQALELSAAIRGPQAETEEMLSKGNGKSPRPEGRCFDNLSLDANEAINGFYTMLDIGMEKLADRLEYIRGSLLGSQKSS